MSEYSSLIVGSRQSLNPPNFAALSLAGSARACFERQLVAAAKRAVAVGVRAALPGQPGIVVLDRQAVGAERVAGRAARKLRVLPVERLPGLRRRDLFRVIVTLRLAGADDWVGWRGAKRSQRKAPASRPRTRTWAFPRRLGGRAKVRLISANFHPKTKKGQWASFPAWLISPTFPLPV